MVDKSVFDMGALLATTCDDRGFAGNVVTLYLDDIPKQLRSLAEALAANDAKTAERVAHSIKGASATIGGEAVRAVAHECEKLGNAGDLSGVRALVPELQSQYGLLETALRESGLV